MIKVYHEAPLSIFKYMQTKVDGDYFLVHLFEKNKEYLEAAINSSQEGREVILDNSVFELGKAFDADKYISWIIHTEPSWYIIPDVLGDMKTTVQNVLDWNKTGKFHRIAEETRGKSKPIAVAQGQSQYEILRCYDQCSKYVSMMSIPFALPFFANEDGENIHEKRMRGRQRLMYYLTHHGGVMKSTHLLGCALPQEGLFYKDLYPNIVSVDTSNPVLHGMAGVKYNISGLNDKLPGLMVDQIDAKIDLQHKFIIEHNVDKFRSFWS